MHFFAKGMLLLLMVALLDFSIGGLLKRFYYRQQSGNNYQTTVAIDNDESAILILGSSRAANLFNPLIFEQQLNLSSYNAGRYGYPIFYHYALLKARLKRQRPKVVILSFDAGNFSMRQDAYDQLSSLLPYYDGHPEIRPIVNYKSRYEKLKLVSSIYPYNSLLLPIVAGNSSLGKKKDATIKGFIPLQEVISGPLWTFDYTREKLLDTLKINTYKNFIDDCLGAKVKLFIVCPPYMIQATGIDRSITEAKKIAQQMQVPFLDYSRDSFYNRRPHLFADYRHLNEKGVAIFSKNIAQQILLTAKGAALHL